MADVFISYAREDRARIERLSKALEAEGISVWWDKDIAGGTEFTSETEIRLNEAKAVLVAWSAASVASTWVCDEATVGRERGALVPVAIEAVAPRLGFRSFQTIDLAAWHGDRSAPEFADLVRVLKARVAGETPAPVQRGAPTLAARLRRHRVPIAAAAAATLTLVAGFLVLRPETRPAPAAPAAEAGLATNVARDGVGLGVIPFTNLSSDPEQEHFADGLTEELLNWLGNVEGLRVPGRTSSFQFKGKADDLRAIGEALAVDYLLEGSVRRSGDALRITAQLIDAKTGYHRWSQTYDRKLDDLFAIQDELARLVVTELLGKIPESGVANPAAVGDVDPRAHELYLEGRALWTERRSDAAFVKFREAVRIDPRHALAQAYIAVIATHADANNGSLPDAPDLAGVATGALAEAVRLKPQSAEVLFAQGWVAEMSDGDPGLNSDPASIAFYERALRANPRHVEALHALTRNAAMSDQEAIEVYKRVLDIDPAHLAARNNLIRFYVGIGERAQAAALAWQSLTTAPDTGRNSAAWAGRMLGDMALTGEALFADRDPTERDYMGVWFAASTLADLGAVDEAQFLYAGEIDKVEEIAWRHMARINVAVLEGNNEAGLAAAEEMHRLDSAPDWSSWTLATALIRIDDPQRAYDVLVARRPDLANGRPQVVGPLAGCDMADPELLTAANALHLLGRRNEARALWKAMVAAAAAAEPPPATWGDYLSLSVAHAGLGDRAAAAKEFRAAHDAGFRYLWTYDCFDCALDGFSSENGLFAAVVAIPENAALIEKIKAENARTLERFNKQYGVIDKVRAMMAAEAD